MNILLVEDDSSLGETLKERLERESVGKSLLVVHWCQTVGEAEAAIQNRPFDLLILDVGLPDGNGMELAERVKSGKLAQRSTGVPILFLTAMNTPEMRLKGYELGAIEFIPKPFHLRELLLRVHHVLSHHKEEGGKASRVYVLSANTQFNAMAMCIQRTDEANRSEQIIRLTAKDAELLELLIASAPKVLSRDEILDRVWGEDRYPSTRTVDNAIVRIRQALGSTASEGLKSVRSVGYQWVGLAESQPRREN